VKKTNYFGSLTITLLPESAYGGENTRTCSSHRRRSRRHCSYNCCCSYSFSNTTSYEKAGKKCKKSLISLQNYR